MLPPWHWIVPAAFALLAVYQQFHIVNVRRKSEQREELFKILAENAADMIALVDLKGRRLYNSPSYRRVLGYSLAELGETSSFDQIHPDDRFKVLEAAREARETGAGRRLEYRIRHKDGSWRIFESLASGIRDQNGDVAKLVIVNRDVTERKRAEEELEHHSFHDALTGLPNRRLLLDRLQHLFERAQRNPGRQYALLFADVDGFKKLNEKMGPSQSDQLIVGIGRRIEACLREEDTVSRLRDTSPWPTPVLSRLGGDEFTILLEAVNSPSDAMRVGARVLAAVACPISIEGCDILTSLSVGIAMSTPAHDHADELLQEADTAMRRAKALGGGRCEVFDEAMHHGAANQLKLEGELGVALRDGQFRIYYQPILQLETRQIVGFEARLRWQHPQQGLVSPYRFIDTVENSGLMVATGQWIMREACQQLRLWSEHLHGAQLSIHVNVSASQLADPHFIADLETILRETGLHETGGAAGRLNLEVTEEVAASEPEMMTGVVSSLKKLRVGVVLDDFGTGHSSILGLRQLPFTAVKIDRTLVNAMHLDRADCDTVELILLMAQRLKLKVVAEGIESAKQVERLLALGCEFGQGYLFSLPLDGASAELLLQQQESSRRRKLAGV